MNETQNSMDETRTAETNANSGSTQGERPVSKKKKTSDDDNLVQVLRESIVMREERERQQESDSVRLFMLSLLNDFKNIPKHRKLSTKMELIEVIKRAQMETHDSEFSPFRQRYVDYEPGTSAARSYRPQTSFSGQYRQGQGYSTEYGPEITSSGQYRYGTRHTRIIDQKPRPLKAVVGILRLFQTGKTILFVLMRYHRYHQLTQMQQICLRILNY